MHADPTIAQTHVSPSLQAARKEPAKPLPESQKTLIPTKRKRLNTSQKGANIELQAIKYLEAQGYTIHRAVRTGVKRGPLWISQSNDVFNCIDIIAKKRGERTRWIQVTGHSGIGKKKADLERIPWDSLFDAVEIWRWVGGRRRRHKTTGQWLERQYFQLYHLDDEYQLDPQRRIYPADIPSSDVEQVPPVHQPDETEAEA